MIDEKIIGAAVDNTFSCVHDDKDRICAKTGFMHGINWFIQAIWHDVGEEPEFNKLIIIQYYNTALETAYCITKHYSGVSWEYYIGSCAVLKWCYIEDILPPIKNL